MALFRSLFKRRKKLYVDELVKLNANLKEYIQEYTHEVNTKIDHVYQALQIVVKEMSMGKSPRDALFLIQLAEKEARSAVSLTDNILNMVEIEAGRSFPIVLATIYIEPFFNAFKELYSNLYPENESDIEIAVDSQAPGAVRSDPGALNQILTNLVVNAIKYGTPKCPILIEVYGDQSTWSVRVTNEGPGIPQNKMKMIFEPFFTANTGMLKGSGLGLYIVKKKVKALNGEIQVQSIPDKTTSFTVTLPLSEF